MKAGDCRRHIRMVHYLDVLRILGALEGELIQPRMYVIGRGYVQISDYECVCPFLLCRDGTFQMKHCSWTRS
jgi:hypothetical protein